jgi:hypothetical protein
MYFDSGRHFRIPLHRKNVYLMPKANQIFGCAQHIALHAAKRKILKN